MSRGKERYPPSNNIGVLSVHPTRGRAEGKLKNYFPSPEKGPAEIT